MPCYSDPIYAQESRSYEDQTLRNRVENLNCAMVDQEELIQLLTRVACDAMETTEDLTRVIRRYNNYLVIPRVGDEAVEWWKAHQEVDRKHQETQDRQDLASKIETMPSKELERLMSLIAGLDLSINDIDFDSDSEEEPF